MIRYKIKLHSIARLLYNQSIKETAINTHTEDETNISTFKYIRF